MGNTWRKVRKNIRRNRVGKHIGNVPRTGGDERRLIEGTRQLQRRRNGKGAERGRATEGQTHVEKYGESVGMPKVKGTSRRL